MYNGFFSSADPAKEIQKLVPINPDLPAIIWDVEGPIGPDKAKVFQGVIFGDKNAAMRFLKYHNPATLYDEPGLKALNGKPDQEYFEYFLRNPAEEKLDVEGQRILGELEKAWPAAFEKFLKTYRPYAEIPALLKYLSGQGYAMAYASCCNGVREVLRVGEVLPYMQGGIAPSAELQGRYQCIIEPKAQDQKEMEAKIEGEMRDKPEVDIFAQTANLVLHKQPSECVIVEDCEKAAFNAEKFLAFFLITKKTKAALEQEFHKKLPENAVLIQSAAEIKNYLPNLCAKLKEARAHEQEKAPAASKV
jgi:beta-phosphoglucomutase-like phosphatase (HAD superfamily)